jgi:hypothetical protein
MGLTAEASGGGSRPDRESVGPCRVRETRGGVDGTAERLNFLVGR